MISEVGGRDRGSHTLNQKLEESGEDLNTHSGEWENKLTRRIYSIFVSVKGPFTRFIWFATIILNCSQIITRVLDISTPPIAL